MLQGVWPLSGNLVLTVGAIFIVSAKQFQVFLLYLENVRLGMFERKWTQQREKVGKKNANNRL